MTGPLRNALDAQGFGMSALNLFVTFVSSVEFDLKWIEICEKLFTVQIVS